MSVAWRSGWRRGDPRRQRQLDTSGEARLRYHCATEAATAGIKLRGRKRPFSRRLIEWQ